MVVAIQLVHKLVDLDHRVSRDDPQSRGLASPPVLLARIDVGEVVVGRFDGARVLKGLAFALLPEDFVDH